MYSDNLDAESKAKVLPSTQRKDGTWRKEIKIRPGYVNQDEVARYQNPKKREQDEQQKRIKEARARYEGVPAGYDPDEWKQIQEAEEKKKQKKRIRKKKEHGEEVKKDDNDDPREVPDDWENETDKPTETKGKDVPQKATQAKAEEDDSKKEADEDDPQKQEKKIKKKIRQIEMLEQKQAEGKTLNHEELTKINSKKSLEELLANLNIK